jgi:hypothetical protein
MTIKMYKKRKSIRDITIPTDSIVLYDDTNGQKEKVYITFTDIDYPPKKRQKLT